MVAVCSVNNECAQICTQILADFFRQNNNRAVNVMCDTSSSDCDSWTDFSEDLKFTALVRNITDSASSSGV